MKIRIITLLLVTVALLTGVYVAMQFTTEINWDLTDFIVMGVLLFGTSSTLVLISRKVDRKYWLPLGIIFALGFLWIWAELAVGVFTNWGS